MNIKEFALFQLEQFSLADVSAKEAKGMAEDVVSRATRKIFTEASRVLSGTIVRIYFVRTGELC